MEEVGRAGEGQQEDPRPHHRHQHPKGERPEMVGRHRVKGPNMARGGE